MSNQKPTIYIGADHNGFDLKASLIEYMSRGGYSIIDCGDTERHPDNDFSEYAAKVVQAMAADPSYNVCGILICGSGQGVCMAANRYKGIRAILAYSQDSVRTGRNDYDSNVICLSANELNLESAVDLVNTWLATPFAGAPRFKRRIRAMDELDGGAV